jgi:hypothetical protein
MKAALGSLTALVLVPALLGCVSASVPTAPPATSLPPLTSSSPDAPPTPTVTPSPSLSPSPSPSAPTNARPTAHRTLEPGVASPSPARTPRPCASAAPDADRWIGPELISTDDYSDLSLVVDDDGIAHAAAVLGDGIVYLTNKSGSWTHERLTRPDGRDSTPSIARDADGSLYVAFTRWLPEGPDYCPPDTSECFGPGPEGIFYVTNSSGTWSEEVPLGEAGRSNPSLQVRDGRMHLAYVDGQLMDDLDGPVPVGYSTNSDGSWKDQRIGDSYDAPQLQLSPDGRAHMAYWGHEEEFGGASWALRVWYAVIDPATGALSVEELPPVPRPSEISIADIALALDQGGSPHVFANLWSRSGGIHRWAIEGTAWRRVTVTDGDVIEVSAAIDAGGAAHLLVSGGMCTSHLTDRAGQLRFRDLATERASGGIAVDAAGRPHVLFMLYDARGSELWYGIGPAAE